MSGRWLFDCQPSAGLPPLAWIARIGADRVEVRCGTSVRRGEDGFFEGSWAGPPELTAIPASTTVFGSGIVADGDELLVVPPSTTLESVFLHQRSDELLVSNSFVGLLVAGGLALDPQVPYPTLFGQINRGLARAVIELPTSGGPVVQHYFENVAVAADLAIRRRPKPREDPFASFADYRDRMIERTRSVFANAAGYEPAATMSSGYDSTAAAAVAAQAGCRRAFSFGSGWPWRGYQGSEDSGAVAAAALGLQASVFDRLAYLDLDDAPEAEFLASGLTGEDVPLRSLGETVRRSVLVSGFWGGAAWRDHDRSGLRRLDLSGASLAEFRLRIDFIHLPLPYIGGTEQPSLLRTLGESDMRPYHVPGDYNEPIARRLAEEAGVARGTFATQKRAASARLHLDGLAAMSASGRRSFEEFAGREALERLPTRRRIGRRHRAAIRLAHSLRVPRLVRDIERRRYEGVHIEPFLGSLLLRWAVDQLRERYRAAV